MAWEQCFWLYSYHKAFVSSTNTNGMLHEIRVLTQLLTFYNSNAGPICTNRTVLAVLGFQVFNAYKCR